jgi:2-phospho-L-lactate guanylyltransferase
MQTVAILPVKRFASAKRRLEGALASGARRALAEAMFSDVLTALRRVDAIDQIIVVSADPGAQRIAEGYGARAIDDPAESGQDQAVVRAAGVAHELGAAQVLCLAGDCPLIDPRELETLLGKPRTAERFVVLVPDRHGTGTNGLLLSPPDALEPRYGPGSFARHLELAQAGGVPAEVAEIASIALDVDTPDDLTALHERLATVRGGAAHTRGMLHQLQRTSAIGR